MQLNGVILVSPFMAVHAGRDGYGMELPHALFFPAFAATAWYHDLLDPKPTDFEAFIAEVEDFAMGEYLAALQAGYTIDPERKQAIARKLAEYTATDPRYWMLADLRVDHQEFLQELQRDARIVTGRIDSRFLGPASNPLDDRLNYDPFFPAVGPAYTAAFLDYLHNDLEFGRDLDYRTSAWPLDWDWTHRDPTGGHQPAVNLLPDMAMAMTMNPGLHLHVQQGYYDLATPFSATSYYLRHLDIPAAARERIRYDLYPAGHMMYLHEASLRAYRDDLVAFIRGAIPD